MQSRGGDEEEEEENSSTNSSTDSSTDGSTDEAGAVSWYRPAETVRQADWARCGYTGDTGAWNEGAPGDDCPEGLCVQRGTRRGLAHASRHRFMRCEHGIAEGHVHRLPVSMQARRSSVQRREGWLDHEVYGGQALHEGQIRHPGPY